MAGWESVCEGEAGGEKRFEALDVDPLPLKARCVFGTKRQEETVVKDRKRFFFFLWLSELLY